MSVVLATGGFDHKIRFWDAPSGTCIRFIKFPDSQVNKLEITPDKQFIAAAGNPVIRLYEILPSAATGTPAAAGSGAATHDPAAQQAVLTLEGHTSNVTSIGFQRDGRYLYSGSEDGTVKVWDLRTQSHSRSFDCSGGGSSGSGGGSVGTGGSAAVNSVALRSDRDELISADADGFVRVWDLGGAGCVARLQPGRGWSEGSTRGNGDGGESAAATTAAAAPTSNPKARRGHHSEGTVSMQVVDISEDSRTLVAISNHGTVYVWDSSSGLTEEQLRPVTKFRAHAPGYYCLHGKIAPDCRHLVTTGSDGLAKLWDTATWELAETLENQKWVYDAAFCADSSYLVTSSSDHIARLWNLKTGEVVRKYHGHQGTVTCVALNDASV